MNKLYTTLLIYILIFSGTVVSQRLVEIIDQTEKAAIKVSAHTPNGDLLAESCGFFISSDGIAIFPAHMFFNSDSITVQTFNGRKLGVQRLLQLHPQADLALVKIAAPKTREFTYLIPSKQITRENQDVLIFGHPSDMEDGMAIENIKEFKYQLFLGRISKLTGSMSAKSDGAPVINNKGELVGIVEAYSKDSPPLSVCPNIINDTNWVNINLPVHLIKHNPVLKSKMNQYFNEGLYYLSAENYERSARAFSNYLKLIKDDPVIYALRGHARFMYKNTFGCKEDLTLSKRMDHHGYLPFYFEGLHYLEDNKKEEALLNFTICLDKKPNFSYALVERGRLREVLNKDLEKAFNDFIEATEVDTVYGAGFYEKARFILKYYDDKNVANYDIDKAIDLDPGLPGVYSIRGMMRINNENYLAAIQDLETALTKDPNDIPALFNKGIAEYNLGMKDKACKDWEKAGTLGHYKSIKYLSRYCTGSDRKY